MVKHIVDAICHLSRIATINIFEAHVTKCCYSKKWSKWSITINMLATTVLQHKKVQKLFLQQFQHVLYICNNIYPWRICVKHYFCNVLTLFKHTLRKQHQQAWSSKEGKLDVTKKTAF